VKPEWPNCPTFDGFATPADFRVGHLIWPAPATSTDHTSQGPHILICQGGGTGPEHTGDVRALVVSRDEGRYWVCTIGSPIKAIRWHYHREEA